MPDRIDATVEREVALARAALIEARDAEQRATDAKRMWVRYLAERGVGKTELARLAGVHRTTIYDYLSEEPQL